MGLILDTDVLIRGEKQAAEAFDATVARTHAQLLAALPRNVTVGFNRGSLLVE